MSSFSNGLQRTISTVKLFGRQVFVKRDDVLFNYNEGLSGNKGRKFQSLLSSGKRNGYLLSYGGYQSNTLLALGRIAAAKQMKLYYFTLPIPAHLKDVAIGNYLQATLLGAKVTLSCVLYIFVHITVNSTCSCRLFQVVEVNKNAYNNIKRWSEAGADMNEFRTVFNPILPVGLEEEAVDWVPQGGSMPAAEQGVTGLARELHEYIAASDLKGPWKVLSTSSISSESRPRISYIGRILFACLFRSWLHPARAPRRTSWVGISPSVAKQKIYKW